MSLPCKPGTHLHNEQYLPWPTRWRVGVEGVLPVFHYRRGDQVVAEVLCERVAAAVVAESVE